MSVMWRLAKTCSRIHKPWRRNLKQYENFFRHDHYYSPIPLIAEVTRRKHIIFSRQASAVADVDLRVDEQLALLDQLAEFAPQIPFDEQQTNGARYWLDNPFFPYADGIFYHCLLRHARPRRVIEIGTGYSSAVCLDTCDRFLDPAPECTFVDPDTTRVDALLRDSDRGRIRAVSVQDVPLDEFRALEAGDIFFADSSHVSKVGSDVNHIFFEILPVLAEGVLIHFHDVFYPFEYPEEWIYAGRAWNEAYLLRAFLQRNDQYRVLLWPDFLWRFKQATMQQRWPKCHTNSGSIWLVKGG